MNNVTYIYGSKKYTVKELNFENLKLIDSYTLYDTKLVSHSLKATQLLHWFKKDIGIDISSPAISCNFVTKSLSVEKVTFCIYSMAWLEVFINIFVLFISFRRQERILLVAINFVAHVISIKWIQTNLVYYNTNTYPDCGKVNHFYKIFDTKFR